MISRADNIITVQGSVTIDNVAEITQEGAALLEEPHPQLVIDLSRLTEVDSSAVAMLLEWQRTTKDYDKPVQYTGVPSSLEGLIDLYGLSDFIPRTDPLSKPDPI